MADSSIPPARADAEAGWTVSCGWRPTESDPEPRDYPRSYPNWPDARQIGRALACGDNVIAVTITAPDGSEAATWTEGEVWRESIEPVEEPASAVRRKMCGGSLSDHQDPHARPRHPWTPDRSAEEPARAVDLEAHDVGWYSDEKVYPLTTYRAEEAAPVELPDWIAILPSQGRLFWWWICDRHEGEDGSGFGRTQDEAETRAQAARHVTEQHVSPPAPTNGVES